VARSKLRALPPRTVVRIVEGNCYRFVRPGSHGDIYRRDSDKSCTTIPRCGGKKGAKKDGGKLGPAMIEIIREETGKSQDEFTNP